MCNFEERLHTDTKTSNPPPHIIAYVLTNTATQMWIYY